jgi:hypothetical protein
MTQRHTQLSTASTIKEVNHTSYWHQPSQSPSSNQLSYKKFISHQEYQSNYHIYPPQYYKPYNYTPHANQIHTSQSNFTYPSAPLQITYPTASSQTTQPKVEPGVPPPPPQQNQESIKQVINFPTFRTIHTITGGSNMNFKNKRQK